MIIVYRLLTKETKLSFSVCRKQMEVCCFCFLLVQFTYIYMYIYIYIETAAYIYVYTGIYIFKLYLYMLSLWTTEAQVIFLNLLIVCSSCKWKLVVCPLVYEETKRSYPFANGLNGLAQLCMYIFICINKKRIWRVEGG